MASRISRAARPPSPPSSAVAAVAVHHSTRNFSGAALAHMKPAAPAAAAASTVAVSSFAFRSLPAATMAGVYSAPHPTRALPPSSVVHRVGRGAAKRWQPSTRTAALLSALRSPLWSAMRTMPVMEPTGLITPARVTFADGAGGRRAQSTYGTNVEQLTRPGGATTFENPIPVPQPLTPGSGPGSGRAPPQSQRPKDVVFTERKLTVGGEREDPQQNKPLEKPLLKGLDPKLSTFQDTTLADVIRDKGSETVLWIDEGAFIFDAVKKMDLCRVGGLLVKGRDGAVAGIVTERDYLTKVALRGLNSRDTKVEQIMSRDLKFGTMKQSSREALSLMTQYRFRHLPVVGDSGELVGLISIGDLVKSILAEVAETAEFYRDFVEGKYRYSASYQEGYRDDIKS